MVSNFVNLLAEEVSVPGIPEIMGQLFPNLPNFIAHVLATIVIVIILSKLVYKPFRKAIDNRRAKINELLDDVVMKQTLANKDRKEAESLLKDAKTESVVIVKNARVDADAQRSQIIENATSEATNIQNHAKNSIEREKAKAQEEIKQTIIDVAFTAASHVLKSEIDEKKNKALVEDFIDNLD
ncbi:F0F1 ATP synthase subunit B [[Acholeplasma] multilocale]|uniref:F0F1 ATP synthase subunit B n=1 Tax=[Acholeplasma] multilocale TaxID=264638 RepID=UPI000412E46A|nr:F0F1 ATP synthase subunit B [[Acholeplasma] multilocale]